MTVRISLGVRKPDRPRRPPLKGARDVASILSRALWLDMHDARLEGLVWGDILALVRQGVIKAVRLRGKYLVLRLSVRRAQRKGLLVCKRRELTKVDRLLLGVQE